MMRYLFPFSLLALILAVGRCGQPVCLLGFGQCDSMFISVSPVVSGAYNSLVISGPSSATVGITSTYTATGGSESYTWSVSSPPGCGEFPTPSVGNFLPQTHGVTCYIEVTDTSDPVQTGTYAVTIP